MTTKLDRPLKREIDIGGATYTLTLTRDGLKLVQKGHRKGYELAWSGLVSGDAALTQALNTSVAEAPSPTLPGD